LPAVAYLKSSPPETYSDHRGPQAQLDLAMLSEEACLQKFAMLNATGLARRQQRMNGGRRRQAPTGGRTINC
jgi:hypothetical protein